jgi:hypothetical protein
MFKLSNTSKTNGTHDHCIRITATPDEMMLIAKNNGLEYYDGNGDENEKSQYDFDFENEDGVVFTAYDWKYYRILEGDEMIIWHIGAHSTKDAQIGYNELREQLKLIR